MERKYLFPHFSMSNHTLEKCLIKKCLIIYVHNGVKVKMELQQNFFYSVFSLCISFSPKQLQMFRKHFMKYYFEGNFISDFKLTLSPLCAIYANDTQKRTCVIQVSLFLTRWQELSFHIFPTKNMSRLWAKTQQYKKRFIVRMKQYFVSKIVLIYYEKKLLQ